jgi:23S rRNA (uracil1939-C5)-methyltransferase
LLPGASLELTVERPAVGGRMIARADGRIVLVAGAIPGERVVARVERVGKGVAYARTLSVEEASADRRAPFADPLCGGCLYAHIAYTRQLAIKAEIVADALARLAGIELSAPVPVVASPDEGYRMRARLRVIDGRSGFYREGTHDLCDARATRQLLPATCDVLDRLSAGIHALGAGGRYEIEVAENAEATERVAFVRGVHLDSRHLTGLENIPGLTGLVAGRGPLRTGPQPPGCRAPDRRARPEKTQVLAGSAYVTDAIPLAVGGITLRRHVLSFFQGNRYLLRDLVADVADSIDSGSVVTDLYAGVGLFALAAAVVRSARVTAVEGEPVAALDLLANAQAAGAGLTAIHESVEGFLRRVPSRPDALIVDPPRTGISPTAIEGIAAARARRIVYVSCDVATLARDARRLGAAGYSIESIRAFDMFPNTPHVETVVSFVRGA